MLVIILVTCCSQIIILLNALLWLLQILLGILQYAATSPRNGHRLPFLVWSVCVPNSDTPLKFHKYSPKTHYWCNVCSKCLPLALMHAQKRVRHCLTALSINVLIHYVPSCQDTHARSSSMSLIRFLWTFSCITSGLIMPSFSHKCGQATKIFHFSYGLP